MRIAAVTCVYPPYRGGIGQAAERQSRLMVELGHEVHVFCPAAEGEPAGVATGDDGITVHRFGPLARYNNSALLPGLARAMRGFDAAWIHYPFFGGAEPAALGAWLHRIPYAVGFHMDVVGPGLRGAVLAAHSRTLAPVILRGARAVTVGSRDHALHSSLGRRGLRNLIELPYGVDTDRYSPGTVSPDERREMGVDPDAPVIAFVGGMDVPHAFKGVDVLLRAFAGSGLRDRAQIVLVGDGELRAGYERTARDLGVAGRVRFLGRAPEDDLVRVYRMATVTVLPSTTEEEAFGIVLIEAMACGSPVVASALPGVRSVVGDGEQARGIATPPGDAAALAAALETMVDDAPVRDRFAERALRAARGRYSRDAERRQLAVVLDRVRPGAAPAGL